MIDSDIDVFDAGYMCCGSGIDFGIDVCDYVYSLGDPGIDVGIDVCEHVFRVLRCWDICVNRCV